MGIIFKVIYDILVDLVSFIIQLAKGVITAITKIPPAILLVLIGFGILYRDELLAAGKDILATLKQKSNEIVRKLLQVLKEFQLLLGDTLELAKLGASVTLEFLGFLLAKYGDMNDQLKELKFDKGIDFRGLTAPNQPV